MKIIRTFLFALFFSVACCSAALADVLPFAGPSGNANSQSPVLALAGLLSNLLEAMGFVWAVKVAPLGLTLLFLPERRLLGSVFLLLGISLGALGFFAPGLIDSFLASLSEGSHFQ